MVGEPLAARASRALFQTFRLLYYTKLRSICLWSADLGDEACAEVAATLPYHQNLVKLEMSDCGVGRLCSSRLAKTLRTCRPFYALSRMSEVNE